MIPVVDETPGRDPAAGNPTSDHRYPVPAARDYSQYARRDLAFGVDGCPLEDARLMVTSLGRNLSRRIWAVHGHRPSAQEIRTDLRRGTLAPADLTSVVQVAETAGLLVSEVIQLAVRVHDEEDASVATDHDESAHHD